jgi:hypothetical protein
MKHINMKNKAWIARSIYGGAIAGLVLSSVPSNAAENTSGARAAKFERYLPWELVPQMVRYYDPSQPVLEHPWKSVSRAAGFESQDAYIFAKYPSIKSLPAAEKAAALKGIKRTLTPFVEQAPDGRVNPALAEFSERYLGGVKAIKDLDAAMLADLYFHAQSPLRNAPPEDRALLRERMIAGMFANIKPEAMEPGYSSGEYEVYKILRPYLLLEIFEPNALTMDQRRLLNRVMKQPLYGYNGQIGMVGYWVDVLSGIFNKNVFTYNNFLDWSALIELQTARYGASKNLWPGYPEDYATHLRDIAVEIARNYSCVLMGDGASRYTPNNTHAYYYEGPQLKMLLTNYLYTYDESDPKLMSANKALQDFMLAMGNYYEITSMRVVESDADSLHANSRAQMSEGKAFGNELVHRDSDPGIHWVLANVTGNRWLRQTGPALVAQKQLEDPKEDLRYLPFTFLAAWNPAVKIGPDPSTGPGFRQDYLLWDRNNLGATGKFGNWGFQFVGRGVVDRKANPEDVPESFFQKNTFAGFIARNNGAAPAADGRRMDHRLAHLTWVGIFPEKVNYWHEIKRAHPEDDGVAPGYPPHWQKGVWSAAQTDRFATMAALGHSKDTNAVCRELWLATANGAVGLLSGDVSRDPKNGDSYARLSFNLQGYLGSKIRSHKVSDGFHVVPPGSPDSIPALTPDGNGFDLLNLRVRVLEQNFTPGAIFAHLKKPEDFYPVDKEGTEMRGPFERRYSNLEASGAFSREVQVRKRFAEEERPLALVSVGTVDCKTPITGRRITLPGVAADHLALQVTDGNTRYLAIFNPGSEALDLRTCSLGGKDLVRAYRSGARYRPDFLGNVEVNPEADKEDEVVYGSVVQNPESKPMSEAIREVIPPHAHLVLVTENGDIRTGGPGLEVRPEVAQWRFRPENRAGETTGELTGKAPDLKGGTEMAPDALMVDSKHTVSGDTMTMPAEGTVRFWIRPESEPAETAWLFSSGGSKGVELGWGPDGLWVRKDGKSRRFAGKLEVGIWQPVVFRYASNDPATWNLRVHDMERDVVQGDAEAAAGPDRLTLGHHLAAAFKDLAVHDAVLTPGELNHLVDREQPENYNRIVFKGAPADVFVNGNRLRVPTTRVFDSNKLTRHLKPGENVIGFELANLPKSANLSVEVWIHGRKLEQAVWEACATDRESLGSWILGAYAAHIKQQKAQMEKLSAGGKAVPAYRKESWRTSAYDRPWLMGRDHLNWQPLSTGPEPLQLSVDPLKDTALQLLRVRFSL